MRKNSSVQFSRLLPGLFTATFVLFSQAAGATPLMSTGGYIEYLYHPNLNHRNDTPNPPSTAFLPFVRLEGEGILNPRLQDRMPPSDADPQTNEILSVTTGLRF